MNFIKQNKIILIIVLMVIAAIGIYYFLPLERDGDATPVSSDWMEEETVDVNDSNLEEAETISKQDEDIIVDVKGAIRSPGVYKVLPGDRVIDVIESAGGLLENADQNNINFAMKVVDEMVLYIPIVGEDVSEITEGGMNQGDDEKVNLNKASETDLQTLTGIGPSKAKAIIEYREKNGSFKEIEELMEISGIGEKTFEKLKDQIIVR